MFGRRVIESKSTLLFILNLVQVNCCYWNERYPYQWFGSKTPYETLRGDIRDNKTPENCQAISIWNLNRHGNKNPGPEVTVCMKEMAMLKDEIIASYEFGTSQLCAQDIEDFRKWTWNDTLHVSHNYLTGVGYEELYGIGKRIREKYHHLLNGSSDQFTFRSTTVHRTVVSRVAFVHGLTEGISLNVTVEVPRVRDDVIAAYYTCDWYNKFIKAGNVVTQRQIMYFTSPEFVAVQKAVQQRLGISTQLNTDNVFCIYDLCRYYRSWSPNLKSPWCAVFSYEDLLVLEYYDDLIHYYRNGYGSWVNINLGKTAFKNLYESFEAAINGTGKKLISYFTHETLTEMMCSALGLYSGDDPLQADVRNPNRMWRTSYFAGFAVNVIAVLNSCNEEDNQTYRVQFFLNEKETTVCPLKGCTWQEFQNKFQVFTKSNISFCSLDSIDNQTNVPLQMYDTGSANLLWW